MIDAVDIAGRRVGYDEPASSVAEIGINHNGDLAMATQADLSGGHRRL